MKNIILAFMIFTLSACSAVETKVVGIVGNDLQSTVDIAEKYGKPEIATCAKFLKQSIDGDTALAKEDTKGLISLALKLYLLQESKPAAEEEFKKQCGTVAAGLLLQAGKSMQR